MTSRRLLVSALDRVFPHLLILLYSLGAAVIYDHHWPYRGHGDNPILDLVDFHHPAFYKALTVWHYLAPGVATYLAALVLPSLLTLIGRWRPSMEDILAPSMEYILAPFKPDPAFHSTHRAAAIFAFTGAWLHYYYRPFPQHGDNPVLDPGCLFTTPAFTQPSLFGITWLPGSPYSYCSQDCFSFPSTAYGSPQTAHRPQEVLFPPGRCPPTTTHSAL